MAADRSSTVVFSGCSGEPRSQLASWLGQGVEQLAGGLPMMEDWADNSRGT